MLCMTKVSPKVPKVSPKSSESLSQKSVQNDLLLLCSNGLDTQLALAVVVQDAEELLHLLPVRKCHRRGHSRNN